MKKTYIEILELLLEKVDDMINQYDCDNQYDINLINLRLDIKHMLLTLKKQKTKITNDQVNYIVDLKLRVNKRSDKNEKV